MGTRCAKTHQHTLPGLQADCAGLSVDLPVFVSVAASVSLFASICQPDDEADQDDQCWSLTQAREQDLQGQVLSAQVRLLHAPQNSIASHEV